MRENASAQLNRQGNEHFSRGHYTEACECYAKALECDRKTGDQRALVATLGNLANICAVSGRRESAQQYYEEVLELQKLLGDERGIGTTLANLGNLRADGAEYERARAYYLEALDILKRTHDETALSVLFSDLGFVARETGQYGEAMKYYEQSLALMKRLGNEGGMADAWRMMARTIAERLRDELRVGGARYVMAGCCEQLGQLREAADLLELVVEMDRKYNLPKLQENIGRLEALKARLAEGARA
jgi:tetratricopeptide (TPR) repeat protein